MPRTILCSAGTSIAQGTKALGAFLNSASTWDDDASELRKQIAERLGQFDLGVESGRVKASAELNALHRLPVRKDDEVVLFATDTADGRWCANAVRAVLIEHFHVSKVTVERVVGLQVRDKDALRKTGIINLTRRLIHYLDDPQRRYGGGCVLNTNGGFKGLVPFFAILGMIFRAPVVYVFEFAECLISLPPLPVGFATDLFERALPALMWAEKEGAFSPHEFYRRIPGFSAGEEEWFGSFLEVVDDSGAALAGLSPLATVLARREQEGALELWVSPDAAARYANLSGNLKHEAEHHMRKLASPLWRSQHRATKYTSDLEFYPEDRAHNPWRFTGYSEGDRFNLCWFTNQHDEYDNEIPKHQRADYRRPQFTKLSLPAPAAAAPLPADDPDAGRPWDELRTELLELRASRTELNDAHARLKADDDKLRTNYRAASKEIADLKTLLKRRDRTIEDFRKTSALAGARAAGAVSRSGESLRGRVVEARYAGSKGKSHRFQFQHEGGTLSACVPKTMVPDMHFSPDASFSILLGGQNSGVYSASLVQADGGPA